MKKQISPSQTNGTNPKHINWRTWLVATLLAIYPLFLCYQFITGFSTPGGASIIMPADEDGPGYDRFYSETKRLAAACNCPVTFEKKDTAVHFIVWRDSTWFHDPYHLPYDPSTVSYTRYKQALDSMEWLKQRVVRPAQEMQTFAGDYLGIARRANPVSSRPQLKTLVSHPDSQEILYPDTAADAAV
ncbi:MAG TPA: hypothetical protein PKE63_08340, partial [Lacibacter sp.]|nr:hypothetical protein [Lacibacter sp.]